MMVREAFDDFFILSEDKTVKRSLTLSKAAETVLIYLRKQKYLSAMESAILFHV